MSHLVRIALIASSLALSLFGACSSSHMNVGEADAGGDARGVDAGRDAPAPDGGDRCPDGIDPFHPSSCSTEGAHCTNGATDPCGAFVACDCTMGQWQCIVAEPDPVCSCGREPSAGDRCGMDGASCGECCPTPGGTGWAAMTCVTGHWQPAPCPDIVCPAIPEPCPADRASVLGTSCRSEGQSCGDACCGSAFTCTSGLWVPGPDAECLCDPSSSFACGPGTCRRGQACTNGCGPTDGIVYSCTPLPVDCTSCSCATVPPGYTCQARGGTVFFELDGLCG